MLAISLIKRLDGISLLWYGTCQFAQSILYTYKKCVVTNMPIKLLKSRHFCNVFLFDKSKTGGFVETIIIKILPVLTKIFSEVHVK